MILQRKVKSRKCYTEGLAGRTHPLLGVGLLHASRIAGGTEMATLPDRCLLSVERRTLPGEIREGVLAEIEAVLDACRATDPTFDASARVTLARDPFEIAADHPFVALVRGATARAIGAHADVEWVRVSGTVACAPALAEIALDFCG